MKFIFLHIERNNDININIKAKNNLNDDLNYWMTLFINDKIFNNYNSTNNNIKIIIKSNSIKEICRNNLQPCKVEFIIGSKLIEEISGTIEVLVNTILVNNFDNYKKMLLLILCFSKEAIFIILILIIFTIFLIYKNKKKSFYRLQNENKSISFKKVQVDNKKNQLKSNNYVN